MNDKEIFATISSGSDKQFTIAIDDKYDGNHWKGDFVLRYNGAVKDSIAIGLQSAKLREGLPEEHMDKLSLFLIEAQASIMLLTESKPSWVVDVTELPTQLVLDVYTEYVNQVHFFRTGNHQEDTTDIESDDSEASSNDS